MGNLNCFTSHGRRSQWFNEWQNNSSYTNPYDYYDREYYQRMKSNENNLDPERYGYYQENPNYSQYGPQMTMMPPPPPASENYQFSVDRYNQEIYNNDAMITQNKVDTKKEMHDDVTEAFMSDWFAREEAELNYNIKALREGDSKSESNHESAEVNTRHKVNCKIKEDTISTCSSDSGMCDLDKLTKDQDKGDLKMGFSTRKNGFCCYTAYIMCNNTADWDNFLSKTARIMTGLQRQFQCKMRFSDKICFHRGNSVRTFQIIGSNKGNVIRCKVALPQAMVKLLITSMSGSSEVEEYSRECSISREALIQRK